jgi:hypothetical protein
MAGPVRRLIQAHARRQVGAGADEFQLATRPELDHAFYPVRKADAQALFGWLVPIRRVWVTCSRSRDGPALVEARGANPGRLLTLDGRRRAEAADQCQCEGPKAAARPSRHACLP